MHARFKGAIATSMLWASLSQGAHACDRWLLRPFTLTQSNGFKVNVNVSGPVVRGDANYETKDGWVQATMSNGTLTTNHLHFLLAWENGTVGIYDVDIDDSGRLQNGKTYDRDNPGSKGSWTTGVKFKCCVTTPRPTCASGRACGNYCV